MMRKEYQALYRHKKDANSNKWYNAVWYASGKRTAPTKEEAQRCLDKVLKKFNRGERVERDTIGSFGIEHHIDPSTADALSIVATRIVCREVTEWEDC